MTKASHTKLTSFRRCRRQYHWTYNLHKDAGSSTGQKVGSIGHAILAFWYNNKDDPSAGKECMRQVELLGQNYDLDRDDISRLERAMARYIEFSDDYDVFDVIATEQKISKTLGKHTIEGYVDLIVKYPDDRIMCIDHKFQKRPDVSGIEMDAQLSMYTWLAETNAAMLNAVNVTSSKTTKMASVMRDITTRTPAYMQMFLANVEAQLDEMAEFDDHPNNDRYAYPSPMLTCAWDCNFFHVCKEFQATGNMNIVENLPPRIFDKVTIGAEE